MIAFAFLDGDRVQDVARKHCDDLDLLLNSPGGFGESAEKIVEMCREHCKQEFRVFVPNFAKSAATMIALGGDVILMGYLSELGPIDPQYTISVGSVQQSVSGQSFVAAYQQLQHHVREAVKAGESPGYLQALSASTMEPAFIEHCQRGMDFSRDIARKFLLQYQLPALMRATGEELTDEEMDERADGAADDLLSAHARFSHGRLIGASEAAEVGLHVKQFTRDDATWNAYWELYVRAEVYMQTLSAREAPVAKLFFDRDSTVPVY